MVTNTAQGRPGFAEIRKLEVSDIEHFVKRLALGTFLGAGGGDIASWEDRTIKMFERGNERLPGERVMIDFDAIGEHLSDTIMQAYDRLAQQDENAVKLPPNKEKLLRDKIRRFLVFRYVKDITKTYFKMKEYKAVVSDCDEVDKVHATVSLICMSGLDSSRKEYTLYALNGKKESTEIFKMFAFVFNRQSDIWVMNQIDLNPELITDKFFVFLAYLK